MKGQLIWHVFALGAVAHLAGAVAGRPAMAVGGLAVVVFACGALAADFLV